MTTLDQTADVNHQEIARYSKLYALPEYVKQASWADLAPDASEVSPGESKLYADPTSLQFPCRTKAATFLSWLYFLNHQHEMSVKQAAAIQHRLENFTDFWAMAGDVTALRTKHAALHANSLDALPDSSFAMVWLDEEGRKERHYPLRNSLEVKTAAAWFLEHRDHFVYADRQTMATKLLDKTAEFATSLDSATLEALDRHAGHGLYECSEVADMLEDRAKLAHKCPPEIRAGLKKLASEVRSHPQLSFRPGTATGLCATVDEFDRTYGLAGKYTDMIPRPEDVLFKLSTTSLRDVIDQGVTLANGSVYHQDQFDDLPLREVRATFGDRLAQEVSTGLMIDPSKMAKVAAALPRPAAMQLDRLMAEVGQAPLTKQAQGPRFSWNDLQQLAAIHDELLATG